MLTVRSDTRGLFVREANFRGNDLDAGELTACLQRTRERVILRNRLLGTGSDPPNRKSAFGPRCVKFKLDFLGHEPAVPLQTFQGVTQRGAEGDHVTEETQLAQAERSASPDAESGIRDVLRKRLPQGDDRGNGQPRIGIAEILIRRISGVHESLAPNPGGNSDVDDSRDSPN